MTIKMKHSVFLSADQARAIAQSHHLPFMRLTDPAATVMMQEVPTDEARLFDLTCLRFRIPALNWDPPLPSKAEQKVEEAAEEKPHTSPESEPPTAV